MMSRRRLGSSRSSTTRQQYLHSRTSKHLHPSHNSLQPTGRTAMMRMSMLAFRSYLILILGFMLFLGQSWATGVTMEYTKTKDTDGDGHIDEVFILFSGNVEIVDRGGSSDGFPAITFTDGYEIDNFNYQASGANTLTLKIKEKSYGDTGVVLNPVYQDQQIAEIISSSDNFEMYTGQTVTLSTNIVDFASPVIMDVTTTVGSNILGIIFSEPVKEMGGTGNIISAANLIYTDISGNGVSTISSILDNDASDAAILLQMDVNFSGLDDQLDTIAADSANVMDLVGNSIAGSIPVYNDPAGAGNVDIELVNGSIPPQLVSGANNQTVMILDAAALIPGDNIEQLNFVLGGNILGGGNVTAIRVGTHSGNVGTVSNPNTVANVSLSPTIAYDHTGTVLAVTVDLSANASGNLSVKINDLSTDVFTEGGNTNGGSSANVDTGLMEIVSPNLTITRNTFLTSSSGNLQSGNNDIKVIALDVEAVGSVTLDGIDFIIPTNNGLDIINYASFAGMSFMTSDNGYFGFGSLNKTIENKKETWILKINTESDFSNVSGDNIQFNVVSSNVNMTQGMFTVEANLSEMHTLELPPVGGGNTLDVTQGFDVPNGSWNINSTNVLAMDIAFSATGNIDMTSLSIGVTSGNIDGIHAARLMTPGGNIAGTINSNSIDFTSLNENFNNMSANLMVEVDTKLTGSFNGNSITLTIDPVTDITAVGGNVTGSSFSKMHNLNEAGGSGANLYVNYSSYTKLSPWNPGAMSKEAFAFSANTFSGSANIQEVKLRVTQGLYTDVASANLLLDGNIIAPANLMSGNLVFEELDTIVGSSSNIFTVEIDLAPTFTNNKIEFSLDPGADLMMEMGDMASGENISDFHGLGDNLLIASKNQITITNPWNLASSNLEALGFNLGAAGNIDLNSLSVYVTTGNTDSIVSARLVGGSSNISGTINSSSIDFTAINHNLNNTSTNYVVEVDTKTSGVFDGNVLVFDMNPSSDININGGNVIGNGIGEQQILASPSGNNLAITSLSFNNTSPWSPSELGKEAIAFSGNLGTGMSANVQQIDIRITQGLLADISGANLFLNNTQLAGAVIGASKLSFQNLDQILNAGMSNFLLKVDLAPSFGGVQLEFSIDPSTDILVGSGDNVSGASFQQSMTLNTNTNPTLPTNTGLTLNQGATATINSAKLQATDAEQGGVNLIYDIVTLPSNGDLRLNGTTLTISGNFTQSDINNSNVTYAHYGTNANADSFSFNLDDGAGGSLAGGTAFFNITVNPPTNSAPVLTLPTAGTNLNFTEGDLAKAIDVSSTVTDSDSADFAAGNLFVTITSNLDSGDQLTIEPGGTVTVSGVNVLVSGTTVATFTGGLNGNDLDVTFNANATVAIVQTVVRQLHYKNINTSLTAMTKTLGISVSDGDGGVSTLVNKSVQISAAVAGSVALSKNNNIDLSPLLPNTTRDVLVIDAVTTAGSANIGDLKFHLNQGDDADISSVELFRNGTSLGNPLSSSGGMYSFYGLNQVFNIGSDNLILRATIGSNTIVGNVEFKVDTGLSDVLMQSGTVSGGLISQTFTNTNPSGVVLVNLTPGFTVPTTITKGTEYTLLSLDLSLDSGSGANLQSLYLNMSPIANVMDTIDEVGLYHGGNLIAMTNQVLSTITLDSFDFNIPSDNVIKTLELKVDIKPSANLNEVSFNINPSADMSTNIGYATGAMISTGNITLQNPVYGVNVAATSGFAYPSQLEFDSSANIISIDLSPTQGPTDLTELFVYYLPEGVSGNTTVSYAYLYDGEDLIATTGPGGDEFFKFENFTYNVSGTNTLTVRVDIDPSPSANAIGFEIYPLEDVVTVSGNGAGPDVLTGIMPVGAALSSNNISVFKNLNFQEPTALSPGGTEQPVMQIRMETSSATNIGLNSMEVYIVSGNTDIEKVSLYVNNNGTFEFVELIDDPSVIAERVLFFNSTNLQNLFANSTTDVDMEIRLDLKANPVSPNVQIKVDPRDINTTASADESIGADIFTPTMSTGAVLTGPIVTLTQDTTFSMQSVASPNNEVSIMKFNLATSTGTSSVSDIFIDLSQGIPADIDTLKLEYFDSQGSFQSFTESVDSNRIHFTLGGLSVNTTGLDFVVKAFVNSNPTGSSLQISLNDDDVGVAPPSYVSGATIFSNAISLIVPTVNTIADGGLTFAEINPDIVQINSTNTFSINLKAVVGQNDIGFDRFDVFLPIQLSTATSIQILSSNDNGASFTVADSNAYSTTSFTGGFSANMNAVETDNVSYYQIKFDSTVITEGSPTVNLKLKNSSSANLLMDVSGGDADNITDNSNSMSFYVSTVGAGTGEEVIASANAEVLPNSVTYGSNVNFTVYATVQPNQDDGGFNKMKVIIPFVGQDPVVTSLLINGNSVALDNTIIDPSSITFDLASSITGVANVEVSFDKMIPTGFNSGTRAFGIEFDDDQKFNAESANNGNANAVEGDNDTLNVQVQAGTNVATFRDSEALGEISPTSVLSGNTETFNLSVKTLVHNNNSFTLMRIAIPDGFTGISNISISQNGVPLTEGTDVTIDKNEASSAGPAEVLISFTNAQSTGGTYSVSMSLTSPSFPTREGEGRFVVGLNDLFVTPGLVNTNGSGELEVSSFLPPSTSTNPILTVAPLAEFGNITTVALDEIVEFQAIVKTEVATGDEGFDIMWFKLPGGLEVFDDIEIVTNSGNLNSPVDFTAKVKKVPGFNFVDIVFNSLQQSSQAYSIKFIAKMPGYIQSGSDLNLGVSVSNTNHWDPLSASPSEVSPITFPVLITQRGQLSLAFTGGPVGTEPNIDNLSAEIGYDGELVSGNIGEFVLYFVPEFSGTQSINKLNLTLPQGFSSPENIDFFTGAGSSANLFLKDIDYKTHPFEGGVEILFLSGNLNSNNNNQLYSIQFNSIVSFEDDKLFKFGADNTGASNFKTAEPSDVTTLSSSNNLSVEFTRPEADKITAERVVFEVGPNVDVKTDSTVELNVYFKVDIADNTQAGFNNVKIKYPQSFEITSDSIKFSKATTSTGVFTQWSKGSEFSFKSIPGELSIDLENVQTYTTLDGGYYKASFSVRTPHSPDSALFDLSINNIPGNPHEVFGEFGDAHADESNNSNVINLIFDGVIEGQNITGLKAEVDTFPTSVGDGFVLKTNTSVDLGVLVEGTLTPSDKGYDKIEISYASDLFVNDHSLTVTDFNSGNVLVPGTDYTTQFEEGLISVTLKSLITAPTTGETKSRHLIKFNAGTPIDSVPLDFYVEVDKSDHPVPIAISSGSNAEATPNDTMKNNSLSLLVEPGDDVQSGFSIERLEAELEVVSPPAFVKSSVATRFIVKSVAGNHDGFNIMQIDFPTGFSKAGSVSISTDAGTTTLTSGYSLKSSLAANNNPESLRITFDNLQKSETYYITFNVNTPQDISDFPEYFNIFVKRSGLSSSDIGASWNDIDQDNIGGRLEMILAKAQGTGQNVSSLFYELMVTTEHGGRDLGSVDTSSSPVWQVFIKPTLVATDKGFDFVKINLEPAFSEANISNIVISTAASGNISDPANWTRLTKNSNYELISEGPDILSFKLKNGKVRSSGFMIVSFVKEVFGYPGQMNAFLSIDNSDNSVHTETLIKDADNNIYGTRNESGFRINGEHSDVPNVTIAEYEVTTSEDILTGSTGNFAIYLKTEINSNDKGWNEVTVNYPFDLTNIKVTTLSSGTSVNNLTSIVSSKYSIDTSEPGKFILKLLGDKVTSTKIIKVDVSVNTPSESIGVHIGVGVNNDDNHNFTEAHLGNSISGISDFPVNFFEVKPSYSIDELHPILSASTSELIVVPESGTTIQTLTVPKMSAVFKAQMVDTSYFGFDVIQMIAPPGFTMPSNSQAYNIYRSSSASGLANSTQRLTLNSDYTVDTNKVDEGKVRVNFTTIQNTTNVTEFTGTQAMYYRVEFSPTAPETDSAGFLDLELTSGDNPLEHFPIWGNVLTGGTDLYSSESNVIDRNSMDVEVAIPFDSSAAPNLTDLFAEINSTPSSLSADGKSVDFTVSVKPVIGASDGGINRIGIRIPFGFGTPSNVNVTKYSTISNTTSTVAFQSEYKTDLGFLAIKLTETDTDTNDHYFKIDFESKTPDFSIIEYFEVRAFNTTNPIQLAALEQDVDGTANSNNLNVDVKPNIDLSNVGGSGGYSTTPLADHLIVEVDPSNVTSGTVKQDITVYVKAENLQGQQGFDTLLLFMPHDFGTASGITVSVSTPGGYSKVATGAGLKSDPSVQDNQIKILFSEVQGSGNTTAVKVTLQADIPKQPMVANIEAEVDKSTNPLPAFAFPGDAESSVVSNNNLISVNPDISQIDFSKVPLSQFIGEITYTSATVNQTVSVNYYMYVEKTADDSGFDFLEFFVPFEFGSPSNIKISSSPYSSTITDSSFVQLAPTTNYKLNESDPYNFKFSLQSGSEFTSTTPHVYKVSFTAAAPPFPGEFMMGARALNTSNPGLDAPIRPGDAAPESFAANNNLEIFIQPDFSTFDATKFPAQFVDVEIFPNTVATSTTQTYTIAGKATVQTGDAGFDKFKVHLPPTFTKASKITVNVPAIVATRDLIEDLEYKVNSQEGEFTITLTTAVTATGINYTTVSFDSQSGKYANPEFIDFSLSSSSNPIDMFGTWQDVNPVKGNGTMEINVFQNIANVTEFKNLVSTSAMEVNATNANGGSEIRVSTSAHIDIFVRTTTSASDIGFDQIALFMPFEFDATTLNNLTVKLSHASNSTAFLVKGSDFTLNTSDPFSPKINFVTTTFGTVDMTIGFDIDTPEFPTFGIFDIMLNSSQFPGGVLPGIGITDLDGDANDGNGLEVKVVPAPVTGPIVENIIEAIGSLTPNSVDTGSTGNFTLTLNVTKDSSMNGFDRLNVFLPPSFSKWSNLKISTPGGSFSKESKDFSVDENNSHDIRIKFANVITDNDTTLTLNFSAGAGDFPGEEYFAVSLDNKTTPRERFAHGNMSVDVQPKLDLDFTDSTAEAAYFENFFKPLVGEVFVESWPRNASVSSSPTVDLYVKTTIHPDSQQGYNSMRVNLPYDFTKVSNIQISTATDGTFATTAPMLSGSHYTVKTGDHDIAIKFNETQGVNGSTGIETFVKISFQITLPDYPTLGFFDVFVDSTANPQPNFGFPGDANTSITSNEPILFVDPDFSKIDFSKVPLTEFRGEISYTSATVGQTASIDMYFYVEQSATDSGFDFMEFFVPFDFGVPSSITVSSSPYSSTMTAASFTQLTKDFNYKLDSADSYNFKVKLESGHEFNSTTPHVFKISMKAESPIFPELFFFGARLFSTANPGVDMIALPGDAVPDSLASSGHMEVGVKPDLTSFDATKFPAESVESEIYPNTVGTNTKQTYKLVSKINVASGDSGVNKFKVLLPPSFGAASSLVVDVPAVVSARSLISGKEYTSKTDSKGEFTITLTTPITATGISYTTVSFDINSGKFPSFEYFDLAVSNTSNPTDIFSGWGDTNSVLGDGTMTVNVFPTLTGPVVIKNPADKLIAEIKATPQAGTDIIVSTSVQVDLFIRATSSSSDTAGFDQIGLFIPPEFGIPSNYSIKTSVAATSTSFLINNTDYTLVTNDPYFPKINFTSTYGTQDMTISFTITTPEFPTVGYFGMFVNSSANPNEFFPEFGVEDINGNANDGNSLEVFVHPDLSLPVSTDYIVDDITAEMNTATDILAGGSGVVTLTFKATNTSGIGFNRLGIGIPDGLTSNGLKSISKNGTTLVKSSDYSVDTNDPKRIRVKFISGDQSAGTVTDTYVVEFKVQAPSFPITAFFEMAVDNTAIRKPSFAFWGDANGVDTDSNGLFVDILPDRSVFTEAELAKNNLEGLVSEAVIVGTSAELKEVEASTSASVRVYMKPEFATDNRGIDLISIVPPVTFGTPSNLLVYTSSASVASRVALAEFIDYNKEISSTSKEITIKLTTPMFDITNTTHVQVEFTSVMPELSEDYFIDVIADNKAFSIPMLTQFGDVNADNDDDGDGIDNGLGDNHTIIRVIPKTIANFDALSNVTSVTGELVSNNSADVGATATLAFAVGTTFATDDSGIDRLFLNFPVVFSALSNFSMSYTTSGSTAPTALNLVSDYNVDLSNPAKVVIKLNNSTTEDRIYYTTLTSLLPSSAKSFELKASVDNSSTPKLVEATPGDVNSSLGANDMNFVVKPKAIVITQDTKQPLSSLTAQITNPAQMGVSTTTNVSAKITAVVATTDAGFNVVRLESTDFSTLSNLSISKSSDGITFGQLLKTLDYKLVSDASGVDIQFTTSYTGDTTFKIDFSATAGANPGPGSFKIVAWNDTLPFKIDAKVDASVVDTATGRLGTLGINVTPARLSAAELTEAPKKPVSSLFYEITPTTGISSTSTLLTMKVKAVIVQSSDSGFDQLFIDIPEHFGNVSNVSLSYADIASTTGAFKRFTNVKDYSFVQEESGRMKFTIRASAQSQYQNVAGVKTANLSISFLTKLPSVTEEYKFVVGVDNSKKPNVTGGSVDDVDGDGSFTDSLRVVPDPAKLQNAANLEVVSSVVSEITPATVNTAEVQTFEVYIKPTPSTSSIGFDTIGVKMPFDFEDISNITISTLATTDTTSTPLTDLIDYHLTNDTLQRQLTFNLTSISHTSVSGSGIVYKVSFSAKAPPFSGPFTVLSGVFNKDKAVGLDIAPGDAHTNSSTNDMSVSVLVGTNTGTNKSGFFGEIGYTSIFGASGSMRGLVRAWNGTSFASSINISTDATHNILLQTTPVIGSSAPGFDYLNVDLPFGAGTPTNITVFMRTTDGGTNTYLQQFYDYQANTSEGRLILRFKDQSGIEAPINSTKMGTNTLFYVNFDMPMPKEIGKHFFDLFVLNTQQVGDKYYIEPAIGSRSVSTSIIGRDATSDGTRFMTIDVLGSGATNVVSGLTAEIMGPEARLPVNAVRSLTLNVSATLGSGETFDELEVQLPEGFGSVTDFSMDQGTTTLTKFQHYNLDTKHPRSIGIQFLTPQTASSEYTIRFSARTPAEVNGTNGNLTYKFAVVAMKSSGSTVQSKARVFAAPGDVTSTNTNNSLSLLVGADRQISGTINFSKALAHRTFVKVELYDLDTNTLVPTGLAIPVAVDAGATSVVYSVSQQFRDTQISGLQDGNYQIKVMAYGYQSVTQGTTASPLKILGGKSVKDLNVTLNPDNIQALISVGPSAFMKPGVKERVTMHITPSFNNGETGISSFSYSLTVLSNSGSTVFTTFSPAAVRIDGTTSVLSTTNVSGDTTFNLTGFDSSNTSLELDFDVESSASQNALYIIHTTLKGVTDTTSSFASYPLLGLDSISARALFKVGTSPIDFVTTSTLTAFLGQPYSRKLDVTSATVGRGNMSFTQTGLPTGISMNTSGLISGTPTTLSSTGFPFTVKIDYVTSDTVTSGTQTTVTTNAGSISHDFLLRVSRTSFAVYGVQPLAIPSTGGEVTLSGFGFTSNAAVSLGFDSNVTGGTSVPVTYIDEKTLVLTVPAMTVGEYYLQLNDTGDILTIPNELNTNKLVVADSKPFSRSFVASVGEGVAGKVTDYDIVGLTDFYQGSVKDMLVAAFGPYDNTKWRVFGYEGGAYFEINEKEDGDTKSLRAGSGFWQISRVDGTVASTGVEADDVSKYTVTIEGESWSLVTNLYSSKVNWTDVTILPNDSSNPVPISVSSPDNTYVNVTLWGMDKSSSDEQKPYKPVGEMESGMGYWVYNKSVKPITLEFTRPTSVTSGVTGLEKAGVVLYKPEESTPPEAPVSIQGASSAAGGGGGGGCLLKARRVRR